MIYAKKKRVRGGPDASPAVERMLLVAFLAWFSFGLLPIDVPLGTASGIMDGLFSLAMVMVALRRGHADGVALLIAGACFVYVSLDWLAYLTLHRPIGLASSLGETKDFIYSDKFIIYLFMMGFFVKKKTFSSEFFYRVFMVMLAFCMIKYTYSLSLGLTRRPVLVAENNYELMSLVVFFLVYAISKIREGAQPPLWVVGTLTIVLFISGSRSGIGCIIPIFLLLYFRANAINFLIVLVAAPPALFLLIYSFVNRNSSIEEVDRVRFFRLFSNDIANFDIPSLIFGAKPLTTLSAKTCISLQYYTTLFSATGDGTCYSLILHAFFMRAFYDHGALGLVMTFVILWTYLMRARFSVRESACLISVVFICSLSVSGIGTAFLAFPLSLALAWRGAEVRHSAGALPPQPTSDQNVRL